MPPVPVHVPTQAHAVEKEFVKFARVGVDEEHVPVPGAVHIGFAFNSKGMRNGKAALNVGNEDLSGGFVFDDRRCHERRIDDVEGNA